MIKGAHTTDLIPPKNHVHRVTLGFKTQQPPTLTHQTNNTAGSQACGLKHVNNMLAGTSTEPLTMI